MSPIKLQNLYLRISISQYCFLKFILEGYDGIGILSNVDNGLVLLRYPQEREKDIFEILSSMESKIGWVK
jgi:hypothetical protein